MYDVAGLEFEFDFEEEEEEDASPPQEDDYDIDDFLESIEIPEGGPLSCHAEIQMLNVDYKEYLKKDPKNFIMFNTFNGDKTCNSVNDVARIANTNDDNIPDVYYECTDKIMKPQLEIVEPRTELATTPLGFYYDSNDNENKNKKNDYIKKPEYIKIDNLNSFIVKPDWLYNGIPPEPRIFKKVSTGTRKYLVSRYIATNPRANAISGIHCDKMDNFEIFNLVPLTQAEIAKFDSSDSTGGKKKRKTKKLIKKKKYTKKINKKKKYTKKINKKLNRNTKKNIRKTKNKKGGKKQQQQKKKTTLKKKYIRKNKK